MIKYSFESTGRRTLDKIKGLKIIDVGGCCSFANGYLDAIVEIREPQASANHKFIGDMNTPSLWDKVFKHVETHGKWDYAICTHTLEDIANPSYVCRMMEQIAKAGLIVEPSKYRELARFSGNFRGFMHHRWCFDIVDGVFTGFPKINYLEDPIFDKVHLELPDKEELIVEWEGEIGMKEINDGMPYGTETMNGEEHMKKLYSLLL